MFKLAISIFSGNSTLFASRLAFQIALATLFTVEVYGYFALAQSIILIFEKLKNIQPWQQLTVELAEEQDESSVFWQFLSYELLCSVLSYFFFLALLMILPRVFPEEVYDILCIYSLYLLIGFNGSALGFLRWKSSYNHVMFIHIAISILICVLPLLAFQAEWLTVLYAYVFIELLFFFALNVVAILKAGAPNLTYVMFLIKRKIMGHVAIIKITHTNNVVRVLTRELDVVLLGLLATSSVVGIYKMAKNVAHLPVFVSDAFYYSIYPELVKVKTDISRFRSLLKKATFYSVIFSLVVIVGFVFSYVVVKKMSLGVEVYAVLILAIVFQFPIAICLATFAWAPALISIGKQEVLLRSNLWATIIYFALFYPMYTLWGELGVVIDYGVYYLVWTLLIWRPLWNS